jgi:hypothetical protein
MFTFVIHELLINHYDPTVWLYGAYHQHLCLLINWADPPLFMGKCSAALEQLGVSEYLMWWVHHAAAQVHAPRRRVVYRCWQCGSIYPNCRILIVGVREQAKHSSWITKVNIAPLPLQLLNLKFGEEKRGSKLGDEFYKMPLLHPLSHYNKTSFLVQIKFITEDSKWYNYKY